MKKEHKGTSILINRFFHNFASICITVVALGITSFGIAFLVITHDLPNSDQLGTYEPPVTTRLYSADGKLFAEYATERRIFIRFEDIPPLVVNTFLAVEDKKFYSHKGLDYIGILRALGVNILNFFKGSRPPMGGSTITQQVAKNFLLTNEKTLARKMKEAVLAFKIEKKYSKRKILELYLNDIYLGSGMYGIASASRHYFNKALIDLTPPEVAYLAALPKAPNAYNVERHPEQALNRRNWVIRRMYEEGLLTEEEMAQALRTPLHIKTGSRTSQDMVQADYFSEFIRQYVLEKFGEDALYKSGLVVRTTLNSTLQNAAHTALIKGLRQYDRRYGWRGPLGHISTANWRHALQQFPSPKGLHPYQLAVVLTVRDNSAIIGLKDGSTGTIPLENLTWARAQKIDPQTKYPFVGDPVTSVSQVIKPGDIVAVSLLSVSNESSLAHYALEQIPQVNGAIIVMDVASGRILALEGGYAFDISQFNRALQAFRQPGSAFKPFVYLAALEKGFTENTPVLDAEIEIKMGPHQGVWKPVNITNKTYGTVPVSKALAQSMNLATIWIAQQIGLSSVNDVARRFGLYEKIPSGWASVLGTVETNLLKLTTAYASLMNGGKQVTPLWIDRIQDRRGKTIYRPPHLSCPACLGGPNDIPEIHSIMPPLTSEKNAYYLMRMLQQSVERGAARNARVPGHIIIGKTGTSQNYFDAWFVGGTSQIAVGIIVGFDTPKSLGKLQTGSAVAAPIFGDFYQSISHLYPSKPFPIPNEIQTAWVDTITTPLRVAPPKTIDVAQTVHLSGMPIDEGGALKKSL